MFGKPIPLFSIFGFQIRLDPSWFLIAILVTWSLAVGLFPMQYPDQPPTTYWVMGVVGALGLFTSIVVHELAHSLVARQFGVQMRGITLFIFGGVAEMNEEPPSPKAEFFVAIAGPIASVLISALCYTTAAFLPATSATIAAVFVLKYLGYVNAILVVFNMAPAFPLDGGRVFRSMLWQTTGSLRRATRVTSAMGSGFGLLLIMIGVLSFLGGGLIFGMWMFLIGMFLRGAARMSYQQLIIRKALEGEPVVHFMNPHVDTVTPDISIRDFIHDHVYTHHHKMFPVVENGDVRGCITTRQLKELPRDQWETVRVGDVAIECSPENTISRDADAMVALSKMNQTGLSRLMVVENGRLLGIVSLKDLLRFISLKVELEE